MKRLVRLLVILLAFGIGAPITDGFAQKKTVHVKEYTKKDGTTVKAHDRQAPEKRASTAPKTPKAQPEKAAPVKTPAVVAARNERARIQRSDAARHAFARQTGYPNGRPGYVIDHIVPLACGGVDVPSNMQWQTIAEGKAKDKSELVGCR
jgi:hypothetical protein